MGDNIKPCWWGPQLWQTIFYIVATYPENPTQEQIESVKCFFKSLKHLMPCAGCKLGFGKFSCELDTNIDNDDNFKSKNSLIEFTYKLRNKVNGKLAQEYGMSLNYFKTKLSYMVMRENNIFDGRVCDMIEAPFISPELEKKVFIYLKSQTDYDVHYTKRLLEISKNFMLNPVFDYNDKIFKFIYKRHKKCRKIITKIYHRMGEGKYDIVQSFLKHDSSLHKTLLFYGCSILHKENLEILLDSKITNKKRN